MPVESPEQFELETLEIVLASIDEGKYQNNRMYIVVFATLSVVLFSGVYILHQNEWLDSAFFLYFMCAIGGGCAMSTGIISRLGAQSLLIQKYIDKDKVRARIAELKT